MNNTFFKVIFYISFSASLFLIGIHLITKDYENKEDYKIPTEHLIKMTEQESKEKLIELIMKHGFREIYADKDIIRVRHYNDEEGVLYLSDNSWVSKFNIKGIQIKSNINKNKVFFGYSLWDYIIIKE